MSGVLSGKTIKKLDGSGYNICVIASDDLPYCFGYGQGGELGNNALNDSNIPVAVVTSGVLSGKKIIDLSVAESSACVMDSDEDVYCWGNGSYFGEVGDGLSAVTSSPVKLIF
jgi:alpha-tubulin suppressor-like RCC1 family protein